MNTRRSFFAALAAIIAAPISALRALVRPACASGSPYGSFSISSPAELLHSISTPVAPSLMFWRVPEFTLPESQALGQLTVSM